ncbi:hypothetical protein GGI02_005068, partial [Coemansia sp. RSA 2322]
MNYRSASSSSAATATGQSPPAPQWYYAPETAPPAALWTASEPDPDSVIKMDDLVSRGVLAKFSDVVYQIPPDILASSRSSITVGAAIGSDKRRFNLKWLYDYHWLRFHPSENSMMCALCRSGGRANQFAKLGSKNFKTSALVDHCSSNDHKRSVAQFGNISVGFDPAAIAM